MMQGRLAGARKAADEVAEKLAPHTQMMPMVESLITMQTGCCSALAVTTRFSRCGSRRRIIRWRWRGGTSRGASRWLARATPTKRRQSAMALVETSAKVPAEALFGGTGLDSAKTVLALASTVLDARIAWASRSRQMPFGCGRRRRRSRPGSVRRAAHFLLSCSRVARRCTASSGKADRRRAGVPRRSRAASSECAIVLWSTRAWSGKEERGCRVGKRAFDDAWKDADTTLTIDSL